MKTHVLFYKDCEGDLLAVFPDMIERVVDGETFLSCYAQIGQHSSCHLDFLTLCRLASPKEYASLAKELVAIGYDIEIL